MTSLKSVARSRILNELVGSVQKQSGDAAASNGIEQWKVLIVDDVTLPILSHCCKILDLSEANISVVERIELSRKPMKSMEAIYFLCPMESSVTSLIEDFSGSEGTYAAAHVFFSSSLSEALFERLKTPTLLKYIKGLKELQLEFLVEESLIANLDCPGIFYHMYSPTSRALEHELIKLSRRLATLCASLKEYPVIRYHKSIDGKNCTEKLAQLTQAYLDEMMKSDPSLMPIRTQSRATLIIVDRSIDLYAPLLHEFTYQAMTHDLLPIEKGNLFVYEAQSVSGNKMKKEARLDEDDILWRTMSHMHIAETANKILSEFNQFMFNHRLTESNAKFAKEKSLKEISEAIRALPEYQDLLSKYTLHITLAQSCMLKYQENRLADLAAIEQDIASGVTADGSTPKELTPRILELLKVPSISPRDKTRLLALYFISKPDLNPAKKKELIDAAALPTEEAECIHNLDLPALKEIAYASKGSRVQVVKRKSTKAGEVSYELSRYLPKVKTLLENVCSGTLDSKSFPYVREIPADTVRPEKTSILDQTKLSSPFSGRSTRGSWQVKEPVKEEIDSNHPRSGRHIMFLMGGLTYSEMRSAYEVSQAMKHDLIMATSCIWTPSQFLKAITDLST